MRIRNIDTARKRRRRQPRSRSNSSKNRSKMRRRTLGSTSNKMKDPAGENEEQVKNVEKEKDE